MKPQQKILRGGKLLLIVNHEHVAKVIKARRDLCFGEEVKECRCG
jgi:hypothetical protein